MQVVQTEVCTELVTTTVGGVNYCFAIYWVLAQIFSNGV